MLWTSLKYTFQYSRTGDSAAPRLPVFWWEHHGHWAGLETQRNGHADYSEPSSLWPPRWNSPSDTQRAQSRLLVSFRVLYKTTHLNFTKKMLLPTAILFQIAITDKKGQKQHWQNCAHTTDTAIWRLDPHLIFIKPARPVFFGFWEIPSPISTEFTPPIHDLGLLHLRAFK